jgi:hypothetical protein
LGFSIQNLINRQIYKGAFCVLTRGHMSEAGVWWKGLKELEVDIETLDDNKK